MNSRHKKTSVLYFKPKFQLIINIALKYEKFDYFTLITESYDNYIIKMWLITK